MNGKQEKIAIPFPAQNASGMIGTKNPKKKKKEKHER